VPVPRCLRLTDERDLTIVSESEPLKVSLILSGGHLLTADFARERNLMATRDEKRQLEAVVNGFLKGNSVQFSIINTKILQYLYHQNFGSDVDRDEIASEVVEILYNNLRDKKFRGSTIAEFNVYIYTTVKFRIFRALRRRSRVCYTDKGLDLVKDDKSDPEDRTSAKELVEKVLMAIDDRCRKLLHLKFLESWSDQEIADSIKKTKNATSTAISRCLKKVQELGIVKDLL